MIFALLIGGQLYGFVGAFIALPIAAVLRETVVYLRRHLVLEPWPRTAGRRRSPGVGTEGARPARSAARRWRRGAAHCGACGTELGGADEAAARRRPAGPS